MWNEEKRLIEAELGIGENLIWSGRPRQGFILRASDGYMIPFSILWCGFAVFWESGVWLTDAPIFFRLWGIPFVFVGLYMVIGRFFIDRKLRSKTFYGITNERAIIVGGLFNKQVTSLSLKNLTDISLTEKANGFGIISFGPPAQNSTRNWPFGRPQQEPPVFESIPDAKKVYEIIRTAQRMMKT